MYLEMLPDMRSDHLQIVRDILDNHVPGCEVIVFGSRANGKAKSTSDLDLCIKSRETIPLSTLAYLRYAFSESDLPYKVDIVDWSVLSDSFRKVINQNNTIKLNDREHK